MPSGTITWLLVELLPSGHALIIPSRIHLQLVLIKQDSGPRVYPKGALSGPTLPP